MRRARIRTRADTLLGRLPPASVHRRARPGAESAQSDDLEWVASLIYELLDAHYDTAQLAADLTCDRGWLAHLEYLRALQRTGRDVLAHLSHSDPRWTDLDAK